MEFAEMPRGILLILPPRSVALLAKATLVALANFRDEPVVRLVRLKANSEVHLVDLLALKDTVKRLCEYTILECRDNPVDCESSASDLPAEFFELERIGLEWGCRLLPRTIVALFLRRRSIKWKGWLVKFGPTRIWRMGGTKWLVEWLVMRGI